MFHSKILQLLTKDLPQLEVTEELTVIDTVNTALAKARARMQMSLETGQQVIVILT